MGEGGLWKKGWRWWEIHGHGITVVKWIHRENARAYMTISGYVERMINTV